MKIAKKIKKLEGFTSEAILYELSNSVKYDGGRTKHVIVSAVIAMYSGAETYIFAANKKGEILDWGELDGSYRGGLIHNLALQKAGFKVVD